MKSLTLDGQPIDDSRIYTIATIDYLANTGEYGLDKYIIRQDSPEFVGDYFGEITGPLDGGYVTNSIDFRFFIVSLHSNS